MRELREERAEESDIGDARIGGKGTKSVGEMFQRVRDCRSHTDVERRKERVTRGRKVARERGNEVVAKKERV